MHGFHLSWSLLGLLTLLLEAMAAPNITSPQTVEVDMVFPRNETYGLSTLMPVVFAIQNPDLAPLLGLSLSYTIFDARTWNNTASAILDINWANASSDPYFVFDGMQKFSDVEGIWKFLWEVHAYNCSGSPQSPYTFNARGINVPQGFYFTTKKGAQQPELVTDSETCAASSAFTFNITDTMEVPAFSKFSDHDACAVLSPTLPSPAPSPCQVQVSSATASSIWAALTSTACKALNPGVSCPPTETNAAPAAMGGDTWLTAAISWLAYILV